MTVLGSGTSMGVPSLGFSLSRLYLESDPHDNRTRPSILLSRQGAHVVIDTTPDFRFQALREKLDRLDAIVYTHAHADHILGFDDIRPFNMRQGGALLVYASEQNVLAILRSAFAYVFANPPVEVQGPIPQVVTHVIRGPFELLGTQWTPVAAEHGHGRVLGFRIGGLAYLTDFSRVPSESKTLLARPPTTWCSTPCATPRTRCIQTVAQALELISELQPRRAWFTHIAHDLSHRETNERLARDGFPNVHMAYDGLSFEVRV